MPRITTAQKIRTNFTPRQAYLLQQSYSRLQWRIRQAYLLQYSYSQTSVELRIKSGQITQQDKPNSYSQTSVELEPKFGQIIQQDKPNTTAQLLPDVSRARTKIWSNYSQEKAYILQHSYSQTSVELGPKFGKIIQKDKPNTTAQLLQGSGGTRAKIWSNYTQDEAYIVQHS